MGDWVEIGIGPPGTIALTAKGNGRLTRLASHRPHARPFLKWAGGKQWLTPLAPILLPDDFQGTYIEPFLGGGSLFFALTPQEACLSDANQELVVTYEAVKSRVDQVIRALRTYQYDPRFYDTMRKRRPRTPTSSAARFIYLNRTAFNGLYRVNANGVFNVPFGRFARPGICQPDRLREASMALKNVSLDCRDFEEALHGAKPGDLAYLDPPYITGHSDNGFLRYNAKLFSWPDQERLSRVVATLKRRGVHVLMTNASHPAVLRLYGGLYCYKIKRRSFIAGAPASRRTVSEVLMATYPIAGLSTQRLL